MLACAVPGVRRSEALGLFWEDVDFTTNRVHIERRLVYNEVERALEVGPLKSKAARRPIDMDPHLATVLQTMRKRKAAEQSVFIKSPFVFTQPDGAPIRPTMLSVAFKRAARAAGLPDMRLHDLRHTVVTYTLKNGISPRTVQALIGHADPRFTLARYAHVVEDERREAVNVMGKIIFRNE